MSCAAVASALQTTRTPKRRGMHDVSITYDAVTILELDLVVIRDCIVLLLRETEGARRTIVLKLIFIGWRKRPDLTTVSMKPTNQDRERLTSITVLFERLATMTAFSSSKATLHTASAG